MNSKPELTLNDIRNLPKVKVFQASELLTKEQKAKRAQKRQVRPRKRRPFDDVDAYIAEIIARFGYETYRAWKRDEIDDVKMNRLILAERARERQNWLPIEVLLQNLIHSGIPVLMMKKPNPKGGKRVQKILKDEVKMAKGEM